MFHIVKHMRSVQHREAVSTWLSDTGASVSLWRFLVISSRELNKVFALLDYH